MKVGKSRKLSRQNLLPIFWLIVNFLLWKEDIPDLLSKKPVEVLIVLGAGDLDNYVPSIARLLEQRSRKSAVPLYTCALIGKRGETAFPAFR